MLPLKKKKFFKPLLMRCRRHVLIWVLLNRNLAKNNQKIGKDLKTMGSYTENKSKVGF